MEIIRTIWQAIPQGLKKFVGYGVASGIALSLVVAMYLFWGSGYLQERLGLVATKDDIQEQSDTMALVVPAAIEQAVMRYDTTLKGYLNRERALAEDTLLKPMLRAIMELDKRQSDLLRIVGANTHSIDQHTKAYDEKLERVLNANDASETDRLLRELLTKVEMQNEQIEEIRRQTKKRTSKGNF
jgi:Mg2+ and Co2+ transporter CorA